MNRSFRKLMLTLLLVLVFILSFGAMSLFNATDGTMQIPDGNPTTNPYDNLTMEEIVVNQGYSGVCGDNATWSFDIESGVLSIDGTGAIYDYTFGGPWIDYSLNISEIVISEGITYIGDYAFYNFDGIVELNFPDSLTSIGYNAFSNCSNCITVNLNNVATIGDQAFYACEKLENVVFGDKLTSIGDSAFSRCSCISTLTLPESLLSVGDSAFASCDKLKTITLPKNVNSIGARAFVGFESIFVDETNLYYSSDESGILFDKQKTTIVQFPSEKNISSYTIPNNIKIIGESAFNGCDYLLNIELNEGLVSIGEGAFSGCMIRNIVLPKRLENIGVGVFSGCLLLTNISVDEENAYFSSENGILFDKTKNTLIAYPQSKSDRDYSIPDSVNVIGENAFYYAYNLKNIEFNSALTTIKKGAFTNCNSIESIVLPNSVTDIGDEAFISCSGVKTVLLGDNVEVIGENAFYDMESLNKIIIPTSVESIGNYAFYECPNLEVIIFAGTDCDIYDYPYTISKTATIYCFPDSTAQAYAEAYNRNFVQLVDCGLCGDSMMWYFTDEKVLTVFGFGDMYDYSSKEPEWKDLRDLVTEVVIDSGVNSIGNYAFYEFSNLINVILSDSIRSINDHAFAFCPKIKAVDIPFGVEWLHAGLFFGATELETLHIPDSVINIGQSIVTGTKLYNNSENWENGTLYIDNHLIEVKDINSCCYIVKEGTVTIADYAFENIETSDDVKSIKYVCIPPTYFIIGFNVFEKFNSLTDVFIMGTEEEFEGIDYFDGNDPLLNANIHFVEDAGLFGNVTWVYYDNTLYIDGEDEIPDGLVFDEETGDFEYDEETGALITTVPWAAHINDIKKVVIGEGITSIGKGVFHSHYNLTDVELPSTLEKIDMAAFIECLRLENIDLPDSLRIISGNPFHQTSIKNIILPSGLTELNGYSEEYPFNFDMCIYLESLTIPGSVGNVKAVISPANSSLKNIYNRSMDALIEFDNDGFGYWYGDEATAELMTISMSAAYDSIANPELTEEELQAIVSERLIEKYGSLENVPQPVLTDTVGQYITVYCYENSVQHLYCVENGINYILIDEHSHIDTDSDKICDVCGIVYMCGDNLFWLFDDSDGTLTISGEGDMYDFESSTVPWKDYLEDIKTVVIQDGATSVGEVAFMNCRNLLTVYLADSVISLNDDCFSRCTSLETVKMSKNIETIGSYAFYHCSNLKSLELPDGLTTIGFAAIQSCEKINYIEIPASVTEIGTSAFARMYELVQFNVAEDNKHYSSLDGVLFDKNKTIIVEYPCAGPIENYIIPDSVKTIYGSTFRDIKKLKTVVIGNNVENIAGADVFADSPSLTSVIILNPNITIYDSERTLSTDLTIYGHSGSTAEEYANKYSRDFVALESSDFSGSCGVADDNVKWSILGDMLYIYGEGEMLNYKVNKYAPWYPYRDQITSVVVEEGVTSIGDLAFYKCSKISDLQLPESIERIGKYAFNGCDSIVSIYIPSSVNTIDSKAFHSCDSLEEFVVNSENSYFTSLDGVLYNKDITELVKYPLAKEDFEYFIPETVTSIAASAFNGCSYLTEITVNIETIKESAFYDCANLETVYLGALVKTIEPYAFYDCGKLTTLTLANASVTIGDWAFYRCNMLDIVEYAGTEDEWNAYNFGKDNKPLKNTDVVYDFANANAEPTGALMMFAMRRPPVVEKECQHNYESEITYPTCTSKGYTTYICGECGDTYTADETEIKKHDFTAVETKSTCKVEGFTTYTCNVCGYSYTGNETSISDHIDENADSKCDFNCGYEYEKADDLTPDVSEEIMSDNCSCNCHKGGISGFFFKLILFFQKIFKTNKTCSCGVAHY